MYEMELALLGRLPKGAPKVASKWPSPSVCGKKNHATSDESLYRSGRFLGIPLGWQSLLSSSLPTERPSEALIL